MFYFWSSVYDCIYVQYNSAVIPAIKISALEGHADRLWRALDGTEETWMLDLMLSSTDCVTLENHLIFLRLGLPYSRQVSQLGTILPIGDIWQCLKTYFCLSQLGGVGATGTEWVEARDTANIWQRTHQTAHNTELPSAKCQQHWGWETL